MAGNTSRLELRVREAIPNSFGRFETNQRDLSGCPDLVFRDSRVVVFVHGCYWHRHESCDRVLHPRTNMHRWLKVFNTTVRRDQEALIVLRDQGWQSLVFWECEIETQLERLINRLGDCLGRDG